MEIIMKKTLIYITTLIMLIIVFSSCSAEKNIAKKTAETYYVDADGRAVTAMVINSLLSEVADRNFGDAIEKISLSRRQTEATTATTTSASSFTAGKTLIWSDEFNGP